MSDSQSESKSPEQLLELFLYAPVGLALEAVDNLPKYVERGKSQVTIGRFLARTAAKKGSQTVESLAERILRDAGQALGDLIGIELIADPAEVDVNGAVLTEPPSSPTDDLGIVDYEGQPAAKIVKLLPDLTRAQLDAVEQVETAARGRVTILRKIAQLRDSEG